MPVPTRFLWAKTAIPLALLVMLSCDKTPPTHQIQVPASTVWTKTGIEIPDNSRILIEGIGAISPNGQTYVDANGSRDAYWNRNYNLYRGINHCALMARIGAGGHVHFVGVSRALEVAKGGTLVLGFNDSNPANNTGSLDVSVRFLE